MFRPEMAVSLHGQNAAIVMTEPTGKGRNIHARLDDNGGEKVPEIMVSNALDPAGATSSIDGFLAFPDAED